MNIYIFITKTTEKLNKHLKISVHVYMCWTKIIFLELFPLFDLTIFNKISWNQ